MGIMFLFHDLICIDHHALNFVATGGPFPFPILCVMHDIHLACRLHGVIDNRPFVHLHLCQLLVPLRLISRKHQINGERAVFFRRHAALIWIIMFDRITSAFWEKFTDTLKDLSDDWMLCGVESVSHFGIGDTHQPSPRLANHMVDPILKSMCVDNGLIKVKIRCLSTITSLQDRANS
jgi:hypothetical protein